MMTVLLSCQSSDLDTTSFRTVSQGKWAYGDTLNFILPTDGYAPTDRLEVALRHTNDYPFSNLWLEVTTAVTSGETHTDTINIELCDVFGRWYGNGFGDSYQMYTSLPLQTVADSLLNVRVRHIMRVDTLKGIDQVGIRLTQHR